MEKLGIQPHQLIEGAYIDLLTKAAEQASPPDAGKCQGEIREGFTSFGAQPPRG